MYLEEFLRTRNKKEFAEQLGITMSCLANYISGKRLARLDVANKIKHLSRGRVSHEELEETWIKYKK